jgi:hypothetical protein
MSARAEAERALDAVREEIVRLLVDLRDAVDLVVRPPDPMPEPSPAE